RRRRRDQYRARQQQQRTQARLDVPQVEIGETGVQHGRAEQEQQDRLGLAVDPRSHSSTAPVRTDTATARMKVAGAKRRAKERPNVPACRANSFRSIIGPTTRKVSRAVSENWVSDAA